MYTLIVHLRNPTIRTDKELQESLKTVYATFTEDDHMHLAAKYVEETSQILGLGLDGDDGDRSMTAALENEVLPPSSATATEESTPEGGGAPKGRGRGRGRGRQAPASAAKVAVTAKANAPVPGDACTEPPTKKGRK
jgi:hypothetical protein